MVCIRGLYPNRPAQIIFCRSGYTGAIKKPKRLRTRSRSTEEDLQGVNLGLAEAQRIAPPPPLQQQYSSDNMWDYKPAWCQPWSILGSGSAVVGAVALISHNSPLFTGVVAIPIAVWWYLFLYLVPQEFKQYVQKQKSN